MAHCYRMLGSRAAAISLLEIRGAQVATITRFGAPSLFPRFGLPESLPFPS